MKLSFNTKGFTRQLNLSKFKLFNFSKNNMSGSHLGNKNLIGGFTLVETLVAIAIFATAVTGLISITATGINDNVFVKNKLVASYLSQEGVELIRNLRDTSAINGVEWSAFLNSINVCYSDDGLSTCYIDGTQTVITPESCTGGICPIMRIDQSNGTYGYQQLNDATSFTRKINVISVGPIGSDEILIKSTVEWPKGNDVHRVTYTYSLFNWVN